MKTSDKNVKKGIISIIALLVIGFLAIAFLHSWRKAGETQSVLVGCFAGAATECGHVKHTDEQIRTDIRSLRLSSQEAREIILEAQKKDKNSLNNLNQKKNLTDEEAHIKLSIEKILPYYERVLRVINEMEEERK